MGAWGLGPFENDDAADWVYEFEGADDLELCRDALAEAAGNHGYLEVREGASAVAAAEVLAAAVGRPAPGGVPEPVDAWLDARRPGPSADDLALARRAVERVAGKRSELAELWDESPDDGPVWRASLAALVARLAARAEG